MQNLTEIQIENIFEEIKKNCNINQEYYFLKEKEKLYKHLLKIKLYPCLFERFKNAIILDFVNSQILGGENVGVLVGQCLGEPATQMNLNVFHYTGVSNSYVTAGIPRLEEIISLKKNVSTYCEIYLNENHKDINVDKKFFIHKKLKHFVLNYKIFNVRKLKHNLPFWYDFYNIKNNKDFSLLRDNKNGKIKTKGKYKWMIRIKFDKDKFEDFNLSLFDIKKIIKIDDSFIIPSPIDKCFIDIFIKKIYQTITYDKKDEDELEDKDISYTNKKEKQNELYNKSIDDLLRRGISKDFIYLKNILIPDLLNTKVCGIENIKNISISDRDEKIITTFGSNILLLLSLNFIDSKRLKTNDILQVYKIFGIEAVRSVIIQELQEVYKGKNIDNRHIILLADYMTHFGVPVSITRYSTDIRNNSTLSKASFEETLKKFVESAVFSDHEDISSISASVITGNYIKCGTGYFDIYLDQEKYDKIEYDYGNNN